MSHVRTPAAHFDASAQIRNPSCISQWGAFTCSRNARRSTRTTLGFKCFLLQRCLLCCHRVTNSKFLSRFSLYSSPRCIRYSVHIFLHFKTDKRYSFWIPFSVDTWQGVQLRKHIDATLGSGNLREAVSLPPGEEMNEWLAVNSESTSRNQTNQPTNQPTKSTKVKLRMPAGQHIPGV